MIRARLAARAMWNRILRDRMSRDLPKPKPVRLSQGTFARVLAAHIANATPGRK